MAATRFLTGMLALGALVPRPGAAQAGPDASGIDGCAPALAPVAVDGVMADYVRLAQVAGAAPLSPRLIGRGSSDRVAPPCAPGTGPWDVEDANRGTGLVVVRLFPVDVTATHNSAYPKDRNNGFMWSGRGLSYRYAAGVETRVGPLTLAYVPASSYQANRDFRTVYVNVPGFSRWISPWLGQNIDWPQRFGDRSFRTATLGQSFARIDLFNVAAGITAENIWFGPARFYPLVLSNTGEGFPHVFLGTTRPLDIWVGRLEAQVFAGRTHESEYFDGDPYNDYRYMVGNIANVELRWLPGLYLGGSRVYQDLRRPWEGLELDRYLQDLVDLPFVQERVNRIGNALASIFARWVLPESGFEVYVEWAREDYWFNLKDLIREPDHSQAYMLGFQKVLASERGRRWIRISGELAHLGQSATFRSGRGLSPFYTHGIIDAGHTHKGQLLGAWIGPGSDAQQLGLDVFIPHNRFGLRLERVRYNDDAYYARWARYYGEARHDVELAIGLSHVARIGALEISWSADYANRLDRDFVALDAVSYDPYSEHNWYVRFGVVWRPGLTAAFFGAP